MIAVAAALSLLVGGSLGLLGGGGSILMLPILVYVAELDALGAIAMSLLIVGMTSAGALVSHARSGNVRWRVGLLFGVGGVVGAYLGARAGAHVPGSILFSAFALLMLGAAVSMLRRGDRPGPRATGAGELEPWPALATGAAVGVVSGLIGAGAGFLVVPSLVLFGGLGMRAAIGTSLLVIAMQSLAGFATHMLHVSLDWQLVFWTTSAALAGTVVGAWFSKRVPQPALRRAFAYLVLVLGGGMLLEQLWQVLSVTMLSSILMPLLGGALIGLAAASMWLLQGRIAGISGIVGGLFSAGRSDRSWRMSFLLGLLAGGALMTIVLPGAFAISPVPLWAVIVAGLLVGVGTTLGNGCTSGHGVCGVSRLSPRSLAATACFMAAGVAVVYVVRHVLGGLA